MRNTTALIRIPMTYASLPFTEDIANLELSKDLLQKLNTFNHDIVD